MLPDGRRLGAHLPLADGMARAVERAYATGATTLQVFADNPSARHSMAHRHLPGIANASAPDAGVRCPRDPDAGERSGSCPESV